MKRDMNLIREILLKIESHEHGIAPRQIAIDGYSEEQLGYHIHLLGQAGLMIVADSTHRGSPTPAAIPIRITWEGHDFLEAAREPKTWQSAMEKMKKAGGAMTIEIVKEVLIGLSKQALGLPG